MRPPTFFWAVMSGETGEFGVSDHFREVTKMIVPGSGSTGKSGTICRIPDSSDLKCTIIFLCNTCGLKYHIFEFLFIFCSI